jgi:hypothetical protein
MQGECSRLILAVNDLGRKMCVPEEELNKFVQALFWLYGEGRPNGKTIVKILKDESIEIESLAIQGGVPRDLSSPTHWNFPYVSPWSYFYTKLLHTTEGKSTILAAQIAAHI